VLPAEMNCAALYLCGPFLVRPFFLCGLFLVRHCHDDGMARMMLWDE
jgi:hypothetical protein